MKKKKTLIILLLAAVIIAASAAAVLLLRNQTVPAQPAAEPAVESTDVTDLPQEISVPAVSPEETELAESPASEEQPDALPAELTAPWGEEYELPEIELG